MGEDSGGDFFFPEEAVAAGPGSSFFAVEWAGN